MKFRPRGVITTTLGALALSQLTTGAVIASARTAPPRWYFSSAHSGYLADWNADRGAFPAGRAPTGSTLTPTAPTADSDRTAGSDGRGEYAGSPQTGTFALGTSGAVTSVCVDVWAQAHYGDPRSPFLSLFLYVAPPGISAADEAQGLGYLLPTDHGAANPYVEDSVAHLTALLHFPAGTVIPAGSSVMLGGLGNGVNQPDWTLVYGSKTHPSSLTWNVTRCPS